MRVAGIIAIVGVTLGVVVGFGLPLPRIPGLGLTDRNLFFHVPMWFAMYMMMGISLWWSGRYLFQKDWESDRQGARSGRGRSVFRDFGAFDGHSVVAGNLGRGFARFRLAGLVGLGPQTNLRLDSPTRIWGLLLSAAGHSGPSAKSPAQRRLQRHSRNLSMAPHFFPAALLRGASPRRRRNARLSQ